MRLRVIAILALLLASLTVLSAAQTPDYGGKAKVVLKLTKMPDMPAMPQNEASGSTATFGLATADLATPEVPQGTMAQGEVLYSGDPAVKAGQAYTLYINYDSGHAPAGFLAGLIDNLKSGAVIGVNDYALSGNIITVTVGPSDDWSKKIFILDLSGTDGSKNPFLIDLSGFRQFSAFPAFNYTTELKPMLNMSIPGMGLNTSFPGFQQTSGLFSMFSHFFG
ncbi:hypothetical protein MCP_0406 [Methanocella paludicola SANAE]|uniref:Uncharacterized protein n=1 Tax=Methanocella paludicola (strain DSM 17711 / JCM 13418 / NBRC 101707 / SANAE) TaxID=304371 RepID=D1YVK6_METPS|nr:hypothetical protein [Methanocella paludicola]BAI60478.1 hypothetical protein MCP_0406 [Methanocella paludicola SANAE]